MLSSLRWLAAPAVTWSAARNDEAFSMMASALLVSSFPDSIVAVMFLFRSPSGNPSMHVSMCAITALSQTRSSYPRLVTSSMPPASMPRSVRARSALAFW